MRKNLLLVMLLASGCASSPVFTDIEPTQPARKTVLVESRIDTEDAVRGACALKARESGVKVFVGSPGCSFVENGRLVILWIDPKSYNNKAALEIAGHELYHHHHLKDHR